MASIKERIRRLGIQEKQGFSSVSFIKIGGNQLEYTWHGPGPSQAPTLVFLHEGLGCVAMWRDFPEQVAAATRCGALVYSRLGYGASDPLRSSREVSFMHDEALVTLPQLLDSFGIREAILIGHSDGGSIALIYAGGIRDRRILGLILEAPHVFVESVGLESIRAIAKDYLRGELRSRLKRYHGRNVDKAFWSWNDIWLDPSFISWNIEEYLPHIQVPVMVIQGEDDRYGTWAQIEAVEKGCQGLVYALRLPQCGHAPHLDLPDRTLEAMTDFIEQKLAPLSGNE